MGLTSPALVGVLAVAVITALAATLWWWPKLAVPGLRAVALRIVAIAALQASVLGLIFVVVNRSAEFYSSWSDLFGTENASAAIVAVGSGPSPTAVPLKVISSTPVSVPGRRKAAGGRLQAVQLHGQLSGLAAPGYVYLPAQYPRAGRPAKPLPVDVVISDRIGSQGAVYSAGQVAATAAGQIAAGRLRPVIIVMLPATVGGRAGAADLGCLDVPGGAQAATFFSQDLPQAMESAYQVVSGPAGWALLGDSSGGYCAVQLAMSSSQVFSVAVAPPADYAAPPGPGEFGGSAQIRTQDDLLWRLQHQPMQPISVLFTGPGQARSFLSLVRPPMHAGSMTVAAGKWPLGPVLDWIGRTIGPQS
ncbi:MAG: alpha/beta hydrolase-fold protein [Streptosporangiaceae bacterium]